MSQPRLCRLCVDPLPSSLPFELCEECQRIEEVVVGTIPVQPVPAPAPVDLGGRRIGPYRLEARLGEGGMGTVWRAEQTEPVVRQVALKLIKAGTGSEQARVRSESERQFHARMDHPNIARVLDAGSTPEGQPYLVMELVEGRPITEFCEEQRLPVKERLELFQTVCQAIQHAHQKGIIHRDIKPANVLVSRVDGRPVAKVIDFGIAKDVDGPGRARRGVTLKGEPLGTLEYMSPEQTGWGDVDVDARSDIYSLGVLLYELLTGSTPLGEAVLEQAGRDEVLRRIRTEDPARPSARLQESGEGLVRLAARRGMKEGRLPRVVAGELDWIVMRALEKQRSRRYETASGLAAEVGRYLAGEPVQAGPPSRLYRLRKMVRRHRVAVGTAALVLLSLVAGLGLALRAGVQERAARMEVQQRLKEAALVDTVRGRDMLERGERSSAYAHLARASLYDPRSSLPAQVAFNRKLPPMDYPEVVITGPSNGFDRVHLSPDGQRILTEADQSRTVQVWELATGRLLLTLPHPTNTVTARFTADGRRLVTAAEDQTVRVWDASMGRLLRSLTWSNAVGRVEISPDGRRLLVAAAEATVQVWEVETGQRLLVLEQPGKVWQARFSLDGRRIAVRCANGVTTIWECETGRRLPAMTYANDLGPDSLPLSPDGRRLVSVSSNQVHVWDTDTGQRLRSLKLPEADNPFHSYDEQGKLLPSAFDTDGMMEVQFSPDGTHLVTTDRKSMEIRSIIWDPDTGRELARLFNRHLPSRMIETGGRVPEVTIRFSADGRRVLEAWDDSSSADVSFVALHRSREVRPEPAGAAPPSPFQDETGGLLPLRRLDWHAGGFRSAEFSPDGRSIVCLTTSGAALAYQLREGGAPTNCAVCCGGQSFTRSVFSPDGRQVLTTEEQAQFVRVWDVQEGRQIRTLDGHEWYVTSVEFSPDGRHIATRSSGSVYVWAAESGQRRHVFRERFQSAHFSPDSQHLVLARDDGVVEVREVVSGRIRSEVQGVPAFAATAPAAPASGIRPSPPVTDARFSPDGKRLAIADSRGMVRILAAESGRVLLEFAGDVGASGEVHFSPDGRCLVTRAEAIQLWDAGSGRLLWELPWQQFSFEERDEIAGESLNEGYYQLRGLAFSPDSAHLVAVKAGRVMGTGWQDGLLQIWDVQTGRFLATLTMPASTSDLHFSRDGKRVMTFAGDGTVRSGAVFPAAAGPIPAWFSDLLHYQGRSRFDQDGELKPIPEGDWLALRERLRGVRRASAGRDDPYHELLREWVKESLPGGPAPVPWLAKPVPPPILGGH